MKKTEPEKLREGDVISFYSMDPALDGAVNTHRIVSVEKEGDGYIYKTKGDANNAKDAGAVSAGDVVGKVIATVPGAGRWTLWLHGAYVSYRTGNQKSFGCKDTDRLDFRDRFVSL